MNRLSRTRLRRLFWKYEPYFYGAAFGLLASFVILIMVLAS